jgi:hypothetical protein
MGLANILISRREIDACAALRLRNLVGGDGLEPPTFCV